jgi:RNA polymerase sigma-70 factor (ECF subfamily)
MADDPAESRPTTREEAAGGLTAYAQQLEELRPAGQRFALRLLGDAHAAEEAVQDAFLGLLKARRPFEGRSAFRTYVFAAVRNCCCDVWRRRLSASGRMREVQPATTAFFRGLTAGGRFPGVSTQLHRKEAREIVRSALDELPERQRTCIVLHDLEGFSYREMAEMLDITVNYVGVLLYKARRRLRDLIDGEELLGGD